MDNEARKFRKKPVVIDAIQWNGDNIFAVSEFMLPTAPVYVGKQFTNADELVGIQTLEGLMVAKIGDWIIRGVKGELYPCKPDIFAATYEPVDSSLGDRSGAARKCEFCEAGYAPIGHLYHLLDDGRPNCGNCRCADCMNPLEEFSRTVTPGSGA